MDSLPYALPLSEDVFQYLVKECLDWALCHGLVMRSKTPIGELSFSNTCSLTLLPTPFPRSAFISAQEVQTDYNLLYHRVAHDHDFLRRCLERSVMADDFLKHLWQIYERVRLEGAVQPLSLCLSRSDYMVDKSESTAPQIKQVEMNTISASMAGLSVGASAMHRYLLQRLGVKASHSYIEPNAAVTVLASGLLKAREAYTDTYGVDGNPLAAAILFLVSKDEVNFADQRAVHYEVNAINPDVEIVRGTFDDVHDGLPLNGLDGRRLCVLGREIAVVYMRHGYAPAHYPTEKEWDVRLQLERSRAIKCPSIHMHLAGSKKVQQELARPGYLERFCSDDPAACARLRATFTGLYSLDKDDGGDDVMAVALKSPQNYVMKPQREGGGNNFYGDDIPVKWQAIRGTADQSAYILMDRIFSAVSENYLVLPGNKQYSGGSCQLVNVVSELGVYGAFLGSAEKVLWNAGGGYLLRTKRQDTNEGGVATGFAAIDAPCLL